MLLNIINPSQREIRITLIREGDNRNTLLKEIQRERHITGFRIEDNGIGFNDTNFEAFQTLDTRNKQSFGGKGIGRLFWLKAFSGVVINSTYQKENESYSRKIRFTAEGIAAEESKLPKISKNKTVIEVLGLKPNYNKYYHRLASTLAKQICDEFLPYFILNGWPQIFTIAANDSSERIENVREYAEYRHTKEMLKIGKHDFFLIHIRTKSANTHNAFLCAADRTVSSQPNDICKNIPRKMLIDKDGNLFWYLCLVLSKYLDENISSERSEFLIPEKDTDTDNMVFDISLNSIYQAVNSSVSKYLEFSLEQLKKETVESIKSVLDKNPELKSLHLSPEDVKNLVSSSSEIEIKKSLRLKLSEQMDKAHEEMDGLIERIGSDAIPDYETFRSTFDSDIQNYTALNQSHLISYVLYRKKVLELFERFTTVFSDEKAVLEKYIHKLIFPMQKQGKPQDFDTNHNLWLIDDRLAMSQWIASDIAINKHSVIDESSSTKEPDIAFYNLAYSDENKINSPYPYNEIHIVELKKALAFNNDPIQQIKDYIFDLTHSKVSHLKKDGESFIETSKTVHVSDNAIFYGYVIFDLKEIENKEKWERIISSHRCERFMNGYVCYLSNATIFITSFESILETAKKRNEIFFNKLDKSLTIVQQQSIISMLGSQLACTTEKVNES